MPAVGVAVGIERLIELLKQSSALSNESKYVILNDCGDDINLFIKTSESIRKAYPKLSFMNADPESSLSSQIKYAKKINDKFAIIINNNQIKLQKFTDNQNLNIDISELKNYLN